MKQRALLLFTLSLLVVSSARSQNIYEAKSGVVDLRYSLLEGLNISIYWDDYGAKQAIYTDGEMLGQKMKTARIVADGYEIKVDLIKKKGTKEKKSAPPESLIAEYAGTAVDIAEGSPVPREIEGRELLGRATKGYARGDETQSVRYYLWSGIPLLVEVASEGMSYSLTATRVDTDSVVPAEKFSVPAGVKLKTVNTGQAEKRN